MKGDFAMLTILKNRLLAIVPQIIQGYQGSSRGQVVVMLLPMLWSVVKELDTLHFQFSWLVHIQ